ncbi:MAG TPA: hypothetical protein VHY20_15890, partial [Pirellulales bacterium]|nr:hypothetical protein [Pirellulales bacterium]
SAEFSALLDERTAQAAASAAAQLPALETELTEMAAAHQRRAQRFDRDQAGAAAAAGGRDQAEQEKLALDAEGAQLLALARRLRSLKQRLASPRGIYDDHALAELAALGEMEAAVAAERRVQLGPKPLERAAVLVAAHHPALAWLAANVLARSADGRRAAMVIERLGTYPPPRQAALCWSLLLSGRKVSIDAATAHLQSHPELLGKLKRGPLIELVAEDPADYEPLIPLLVASCDSSAERLELFRLQAPTMNDARASEIERACRTGLLHNQVESVLLEIVAEHRTRAYPLALRLLEQHRDLSLTRLPPEALEPLMHEDPQLAGQLVQQFIIRGTQLQRAAALDLYCAPRWKVSAEQLRLRMQTDHPRDPTSLLNVLLGRADAKALELAEFLLTRQGTLEPGHIKLAAVSPAALARGALRAQLLQLAWQVPDGGQAWALEQLLGSAFVRQLQEADARRARQLELLDPMIQTLDGKLVTLKNVGGSVRDRGLQVAARELARLPSAANPAPSAPEADVHVGLAEMQRQLDPVRKSAESTFTEALDQVDRYLSDLTTLDRVMFEVTKAYDLVIARQLAGARREVQLKRLDAWDFRFPA